MSFLQVHDSIKELDRMLGQIDHVRSLRDNLKTYQKVVQESRQIEEENKRAAKAHEEEKQRLQENLEAWYQSELVRLQKSIKQHKAAVHELQDAREKAEHVLKVISDKVEATQKHYDSTKDHIAKEILNMKDSLAQWSKKRDELKADVSRLWNKFKGDD